MPVPVPMPVPVRHTWRQVDWGMVNRNFAKIWVATFISTAIVYFLVGVVVHRNLGDVSQKWVVLLVRLTRVRTRARVCACVYVRARVRVCTRACVSVCECM